MKTRNAHRYLVALALALLGGAHAALAWDGYDARTGRPIQLKLGEEVRPGAMVEYFDRDAGEFRRGMVIDIHPIGPSDRIEILETPSGEPRTFDLRRK